MANTLGELRILLTAETAKFVGDLGKAAHEAQKAAQSISRELSSLQRVASQTFGAFASFNPVISQFSFALSSMAGAASSAMKSFGSFKTPLGAIASIGAGATAVFAGFELGAIGVAMHAAEAAEKLDQLSQRTGVSVEALSGLGFVAKQFGVDSEAMTTGLQRMDRSALVAATAPAGAVTAYSRLGVSVRDAAGQIRGTEAIFTDIAKKFAAMPDGVVKTGLAMEIFGRSGAQLIPVLSADADEIQRILTYAQKTGAVMSGETAEAAEKFKQTLGLLGIAATGAGNMLMVQLLPALQEIANALVAVGSNGEPAIVTMVHNVAEAIKGTLGVLDTWMSMLKAGIEILAVIGGEVIGVLNSIGASLEAVSRASVGDFAGAKKALNDGLKGLTDPLNDFSRDWKKNWQDNADFINGLTFHPNFSIEGGFAAGEAFAKRTRGGSANVPGAGRLGAGAGEKDVVGEAIGKLQAEAAAQLALAGATDRSTAAMLFQKAAAEADQKVADLRVGLLTKEKSLQEELANARANPTTAGGEETVKIEARIAGVHKELAALDAAAPQFTRLYAEIAAAKASSSTSQELQKKSDDFDKQITSLREVAAAYGKGPIAIASAAIDKQLEGEKEKIDDMRDVYARAQLEGTAGMGIVSPAMGQGPSPGLSQMPAWIDADVAKLEELKTKATAYEAIRIDAEIGKESAAFRGEASAIADVTAAYLGSESARRAAQVGLEVAKFRTENPGANDAGDTGEIGNLPLGPGFGGQIAQFQKLAQKRSDQAEASAVAQVAAENQIQGAYDRTRKKLEDARAALVASGESTLAIDDKIYNEEISHREELSRLTFDAQNSELIGRAKNYDAGRQQIEQFDQLASKVGTLSERFRGLANEIELAGDDFTGKMFDSMSKAVDDISGELAKLVVTGQSSFKKMFEGLAEQVVKASFQSTFSNIIKVATGAGKGSQPGASGATTSTAGGIASTIGKIFGIKTPGAKGTAPLGTSSDPLYVIQRGAGAGAESGQLPLGPDFGSGRTSSSIYNLGQPGTATTPPFLPEGITTSSGGGGFVGSIEKLFGAKPPGEKPTGTSNDPIFVLTAAAGSSIFGAAAKSSSGGLASLFGGSSNSSGDIGNLPLGPGFGSGSPMTSLMSLMSPGGGGGDNGGDSGESGNLPMPPGFGSGSSQTSLMQLMSLARTSTSAASGGSGGGVALASGIMGIGKDSIGLITAIGGTGGFMAGLTKIGSFFGGFLAGGGDADHSHAYIVGEKGPELFKPDVSGTIIPSFSKMKAPEEGSLSNMGQAFGGFRAAGGDVTPGHSYVVGEKHPEVFMSRAARGAATSPSPSAGSRTTNVNLGGFHVHGVQDHDSFRRSESQIYSNLHAMMELAKARG